MNWINKRNIDHWLLRLPSSKLQGSSLIYSVLIALIISSLLASYLMLNTYQHIRMDRLHWNALAEDNLQSGVELWLSEFGTWGEYRNQSLFDSPIDSLKGFCEPWGLLGLIHGTGIHSRSRVQGSCLVGELIPQHQQYSLYLEDRRQPLVIVGNSRLQGRLYLPPSGIRSGFIGRRGYENPQLFWGTKLASKREKPGLSFGSHHTIRSILEEILHASVSSQSFALQGEEVDKSWTESPYQIVTPGSVRITQSRLAGKCQLIASGKITVAADAQLDHCLLFARDIQVEDGFTGRLQAFAIESIQVGAGASLEYPSSLLLSGSQEAASIFIQEGAKIEGAVIFDRDWFEKTPHQNDYLQIATGARVKGMVYADHNLEIQGSIEGQLTAGSFVLKTAGGIYRNHLLDGQIIGTSSSNQLVLPLLYGDQQYRIIEWLSITDA